MKCCAKLLIVKQFGREHCHKKGFHIRCDQDSLGSVEDRFLKELIFFITLVRLMHHKAI